MDAERYQRIRELVHEASRRPDRKAFLESLEPGLRDEVRRLIDSQEIDTSQLLPPPPEPPPPPVKLGKYRIVREIGRGGMGVVYKAKDFVLDRTVALKIVHPNLAAVVHERFVREVRMGHAVEHENVVRTLDADIEDNQHYLVMEYVEGRNLRDLMTELGALPEALAREIGRQAASGLAAIHEAGIVHRDLKPENILIDGQKRVRIMDLGIAKLQEATVQLTDEGQFLGSLYYAAPEQWEGGPIGPAADLYSLGVLLYEIATGTNPFRRENPGAVIKAHLDQPPPPPPEVSPFFGHVLTTLLAKRPEDRFKSSLALFAALVQGEAGSWWREREREIRAKRLPTVAVQRETALYGRDEELAVLREAWAEARAGRGGVVLIEGEGGLGKSRLVDAFLQSLAEEEPHALYGSYPPAGGIRGLADAILQKFGRGRLDEALAAHLSGTIVPVFSAMVKREPTAESLGDDTIKAVCSQLIRSLAADRPTVWVVEDLHFAPEVGRAAALAMARAAGSVRALLVLTSRPGLPDREIQSLRRLDGYREVQLSRLTEEEVGSLMREALRSDTVADALGPKVAAKSDGVPFFVLEMVHSVEERPRADLEEITVPSAVRDLIVSRLGDLSREERAVLDVGAVQGYEFDADLLAAALDLPVVKVLQNLAEIERHHGVVRAAGRLYRFDHHMIAEVMYADLPDRLREEYHARLAEAFERTLDGDADGLQAHFLASHHLRGNREEKGLRHLDRALDELERRYLHEDALELIDRAIPLLKNERLLDALLRKAGRLEMLGRPEGERHAAEAAMRLANELGDKARQARAHIAVGRLHVNIAEEQEGLDHFHAARELAIEAADPRLEMRATVRIGITLGRIRRDEEAIEEHERALLMAIRLKDRTHEGAALGAIGVALRHLGRYEESVEHSQRALDLGSETGSRRNESFNVGNIALSLWHLGRFEQAREQMERQLAVGIELADRRTECVANGNLGITLFELGRIDDARTHCERHRVLSIETGNRRGEAIALGNLGRIYATFGDLSRAQECVEQGVAIGHELGTRHIEADGVLHLGGLALQRGEPDEALRLCAGALELHREVGLPDGIVRALLALGCVELERGDKQAADEALAQADEFAGQTDSAGTRALVAVHRSQVSGDAAAAAELFEASRDRIGHVQRMEAAFVLWKVGGDGRYLEEAKSLLDSLQVPEDARETTLSRVPLHRAIESASDR